MPPCIAPVRAPCQARAFAKVAPRGKLWHMDQILLPVAVSSDYVTYTDRRGMPAASFRLDACYARALQAQHLLPLVVPHPLAAPPRARGAGPGPPHGDVDAASAGSADGVPLSAVALAALAPAAGLLVTGGDFDVPPARYGQLPHPALGTTLPPRTDFEWALLRAAEVLGMPVLGICGGLQLLVVSRGGSLHQDLALRPGTQAHVQPHDRAQGHHPVQLAPGSLLARALGNVESCDVNSTHHQVVDRLGSGLCVVATAPDGVVEAVEGPAGGPFLLAVQWHPEAMAAPAQAGIYRAFAGACRAYAAARDQGLSAACAQPARSGV